MGSLDAGDAVDALMRGERVRLRLDAEIVQADDRTIVIRRLPPEVSETEVRGRLWSLASDLPIADVNDESTGAGTSIVVRTTRHHHVADLVESVREVWGIHHLVVCEYPMPLTKLLRKWLDVDPGRVESLALLEG